nr:hypothetical protein [Novosphingobium sp. Gsoil 351]
MLAQSAEQAGQIPAQVIAHARRPPLPQPLDDGADVGLLGKQGVVDLPQVFARAGTIGQLFARGLDPERCARQRLGHAVVEIARNVLAHRSHAIGQRAMGQFVPVQRGGNLASGRFRQMQKVAARGVEIAQQQHGAQVVGRDRQGHGGRPARQYGQMLESGRIADSEPIGPIQRQRSSRGRVEQARGAGQDAQAVERIRLHAPVRRPLTPGNLQPRLATVAGRPDRRRGLRPEYGTGVAQRLRQWELGVEIGGKRQRGHNGRRPPPAEPYRQRGDQQEGTDLAPGPERIDRFVEETQRHHGTSRPYRKRDADLDRQPPSPDEDRLDQDEHQERRQRSRHVHRRALGQEERRDPRGKIDQQGAAGQVEFDPPVAERRPGVDRAPSQVTRRKQMTQPDQPERLQGVEPERQDHDERDRDPKRRDEARR